MTNDRDHRIDFYRGLALIFIFWDHIPQNPLASFTLRNFGFSDAAEVFVFLAGYAAVLAYGKIALRDGYLVASIRILRRAWVLYVVHIFLLAVLMGIIFVANNHVETRDMIQEMNLTYFISNPQQAMVDELLLRFKPNLMDPLPLYIVLLLGLPIVLPLLIKRPAQAIGLSLVLYLAVQWLGWNIPAHDNGLWYFNPLAWQMLFVLGGATALHSARAPVAAARPLGRQPLFLACAALVTFSALVALGWRWPVLHEALVPGWFGELLYPIDKTNMSPSRLLHFVALAYCVAKLIPRGEWVNQLLPRKVALMGRYSLEVFCLSVVLAPLADMANALADDQLAMQIASALVGAGLMLALAEWLELNKRLGRPRPELPKLELAKSERPVVALGKAL
ncbi:OpgC domain-containing protein [Pseudomonas sp. CFBP 8770]|uniref:OpgC family protein n=1 Tax=unclassified Pseudomonas TaxID=196821 RepID=UPI00178641EF|nr:MULTISPECIES: OpgC domain-containing protein [unclassified Pseudomonas]MBD8475301.1 OpgC domain-containing protein [Pseudomonas sp. CFBP 8773]MBD8645436.1 OpgC domain-containing protein [Pseudomonas sp. CFBP 8770]